MKLADIAGPYNAVLSLGRQCLVSVQLQRNGLRPYSGVLDWMTSDSLSDVNLLLMNRFNDFMELANLTYAGYDYGQHHIMLFDNAYRIRSVHDFPANLNTPNHWPSYGEIKAKYDRRIQRFLNVMDSAQRILFVRIGGTLQQAAELEDVLSKQVKHEFRVLLINDSSLPGIIENDWPLPRTCAVQMSTQHENDPVWRMLLSGISIRQGG